MYLMSLPVVVLLLTQVTSAPDQSVLQSPVPQQSFRDAAPVITESEFSREAAPTMRQQGKCEPMRQRDDISRSAPPGAPAFTPDPPRAQFGSADRFAPSTVGAAATVAGDESRVVPASANSFAGSEQGSFSGGDQGSRDVAKAIWTETIVPAENLNLQGKELTLVEVLRPRSDSQTRKRAVVAYWSLCSAIADYAFCIDEETFIRNAPPPVRLHEKALLQAAQAKSIARSQQARTRVVELQHGLLLESGLELGDELPWPTDAPLLTAYQTKFATLFAGRPQPIRLLRIDRTLPERFQQILTRADSVSASETALAAVFDAYRRGETSVTVMLDTHHALGQQRRSFVSEVQSYNAQIAEYAMAVTSMSVTPDLLVTTLIRHTPAELAPSLPPGIQIGNAERGIAAPSRVGQPRASISRSADGQPGMWRR